jgi:TolB-like protein
MKKISYIAVYFFIIFNIFPSDNSNDKILIKRNVLILPFINSNNNHDYDFLKDTIIDAIKANLMNTNQFNLSNPLELDKKIKELGFIDEKMLEPSNAIEISRNLQSDVVVVGKFLAIDDRIMIQIQAIDVFTGEIVVAINKTDNLGINLLKLIDDISKDLAAKMAEKFTQVDRSYFTEMTKILNKKNEKNTKVNKIKFNLTSINKAGIGICTGGGIILLAGLSILTYDLAGYSNTLRNYKSNYKNTITGFDDYNNSYNVFIGLFCSGITISSIGLLMGIASIPLLIYKKKTAVLSFNLEFNDNIDFIFTYKFQ